MHHKKCFSEGRKEKEREKGRKEGEGEGPRVKKKTSKGKYDSRQMTKTLQNILL